MKFDFLIFDLDGTVIDSQEDVAHALNRLLGDFQIAPLSREVVRTHVGYGVKPLLETALAEKGIQDIDSAFSSFTNYYLENCVRETKLFDHVAQTLVQLSGFKKVVLTNKSNRFIEKILTGLGISQHFVGSYGRESFAKMKPDPLPILSILEIHGAKKERTLMIGDTETDVLAGQSAGVATCLVNYGYGRPDALKRLSPTFTIGSFRDLVPLLANK